MLSCTSPPSGRNRRPPPSSIRTPDTNAEPKKMTNTNTINKNQGFTCGGALCVYLPTFIKIKSSTKFDKKSAVQDEVNQVKKTQVTTTSTNVTQEDQSYDSFFSRRISMAKFEWGSRSSTAIICKDDKESCIDFTDKDDDDDEEDDEEDSMNLYFDLPLELMRYSETDSPEKAAFIFSGYQGYEKTFDKINSSDPLLSCSAKDFSADIISQRDRS